MDRDEAIGFLIVGSLNLLPWQEDRDDEDFPGCCVIHCGPCMALKWLLEDDPGYVNDLIRATATQAGGWAFWDDDLDELDVALIFSIWARHKGCMSVGGVFTPCAEDEDEDEDEPEAAV